MSLRDPDPTLDPHLPQAPSQADWDALSPSDRARVVANLPSWLTDAELSPPEGDLHLEAKLEARDALRRFFASQGRSLYVGCDLVVYYPAARRFAPDIFVVFDVLDHPRDSWVVSAEGKGLDFALEVHVGGDRKKDYQHHPTYYASLGIPEYFVFDRRRNRLNGWRLAAPGARNYTPIVPQQGRWTSKTLGLDLRLEGGKLRFYAGSAQLLVAEELMRKLETAMTEIEAGLAREVEARAAEADARAAVEERLAETSAARSKAEADLARALAELRRLKGSASD